MFALAASYILIRNSSKLCLLAYSHIEMCNYCLVIVATPILPSVNEFDVFYLGYSVAVMDLLVKWITLENYLVSNLWLIYLYF